MDIFADVTWAKVIQTGLIAFFVWWGKRDTQKTVIGKGDDVIDKTATPIQVTNVGSDVIETKNELQIVKTAMIEMQDHIKELATKKDLATAVLHSEVNIHEKVKKAVTDSLTGFAKGKALSDVTVIKGENK